MPCDAYHVVPYSAKKARNGLPSAWTTPAATTPAAAVLPARLARRSTIMA